MVHLIPAKKDIQIFLEHSRFIARLPNLRLHFKKDKAIEAVIHKSLKRMLTLKMVYQSTQGLTKKITEEEVSKDLDMKVFT